MYALQFTVFQGTAVVSKELTDIFDNAPQWKVLLNGENLGEFKAPTPDLNSIRDVQEFKIQVEAFINTHPDVTTPSLRSDNPFDMINIALANKPANQSLFDWLTTG